MLKSLLHKFAAAIFFDGENETGLTQSVPDPKEGTKNPDSEDAKSQMCLEVQQLDRERKKSLLMRFFDGLLARLDQEEEEQPKFTVDIDDEVSLGSECERYLTHEDNYKKEEIKIFPNDETRNMYNNNEDGKAPTEEEEKEDDEEKSIRAIPETSVDSKRRQRKHTIVNTSLNDDNSLFNLGFSVDKRTQKRSSFFERTEGETIQKESAQKYVEQEFSKNKNIASYKGNDNSSALDDNPDLESLPVPLDKFPSGGKRPKRVKDWLRDPNLYKVQPHLIVLLIFA